MIIPKSIARTAAISRFALPLLLLLCFVRYLPSLFSNAIGLYHDDGIYLLTGRALAEGQGYRLISIPGALLQTKYPILYPALLALLWHLDPTYPDNTVVFRAVNLVLWLGTMALTYRLLVRFRYTTPLVALFIIAWLGLSDRAGRFTGMVLTECLGTFLLTASLWFCETALEAAPNRRAVLPALACGLTLGLAFLTRTSFLFVWIALAWSLLRRTRRGFAAMTLAALPAYAGWALWTRRIPRLPGWDPRSYYVDYLGWILHQYALTPLPLIFAANLLTLVIFALPNHVLPFLTHDLVVTILPPSLAWLVAILGLATTGLIVWGGVLLWREDRPLFPLFVLTAALPVCAMPSGIDRYMFPLGAPCLVLAVRGWQDLYARLGRRAIALSALTGLLLLCGAWSDIASAAAPYLTPPWQPDPWTATTSWVRDNVPTGEGVCAEIDPVIFLATGHPAISDRCWISLHREGLVVNWLGRPGYCPNPQAQRELFRQMNIRWFVTTGLLGTNREFGAPNLVVARPQWFDLAYSAGGPYGLHIYHLR